MFGFIRRKIVIFISQIHQTHAVSLIFNFYLFFSHYSAGINATIK